MASERPALPALVVPSYVGANAAPDPIFAAIERHKAAFRRSQECGRTRSGTVDAKWSPEYDHAACIAAEAADEAAVKGSDKAALALTTTQPTTVAGLLALLDYVQAFNAGAQFLEDWGASAPMHWPAMDDDDEMDLFGYAILANVRRALEAMAVQS